MFDGLSQILRNSQKTNKIPAPCSSSFLIFKKMWMVLGKLHGQQATCRAAGETRAHENYGLVGLSTAPAGSLDTASRREGRGGCAGRCTTASPSTQTRQRRGSSLSGKEPEIRWIPERGLSWLFAHVPARRRWRGREHSDRCAGQRPNSGSQSGRHRRARPGSEATASSDGYF